MKPWLTWTFWSRIVGVGVIILGASTWPEIHGSLVLGGLGFLGAPNVAAGWLRRPPDDRDGK